MAWKRAEEPYKEEEEEEEIFQVMCSVISVLLLLWKSSSVLSVDKYQGEAKMAFDKRVYQCFRLYLSIFIFY